jgi:multidrug resistance efflux pump
LAREFEQQQLIGLLQTLGPNTPVLPLILKGILQNSSLTNRGELIATLDQMSQPDPQAQQAQMQQQQMQMQLLQAQIEDLQAKTQKSQADAQKSIVEAQVAPQLAQAKIVSALSTNLDEDNESKDFQRRVQMTELMLKQEDIQSNERIATLQMLNKQAKM